MAKILEATTLPRRGAQLLPAATALTALGVVYGDRYKPALWVQTGRRRGGNDLAGKHHGRGVGHSLVAPRGSSPRAAPDDLIVA
jgi:hypothetical protein